MKHPRTMFVDTKLAGLTADDIEMHREEWVRSQGCAEGNDSTSAIACAASHAECVGAQEIPVCESITKPEIFIGILKQKVFILISYTAYESSWNYVQTINQDIRYVATFCRRRRHRQRERGNLGDAGPQGFLGMYIRAAPLPAQN